MPTKKRRARLRRPHGEGSLLQRADGRWVAVVTVAVEGLPTYRKHVYGATEAEAQKAREDFKRSLVAAQSAFDAIDAEDREKDGDGYVRLGLVRHKPDAFRAELAAFMERRRIRRSSSDGARTLGEYLPRWLEEVAKQRLRPKAFESYREVVRIHLVPSLGHIRIDDLGPGHVRAMMNAKVKEPSTRVFTLRSGETKTVTGKPLSRQRVHYIRAVLRTAIEQLVRDERIASNPVAKTEAPKFESPEIVPLTSAETKRLLESMRGDRFAPLFLLALFFGLRRGELLGLTWSHVDFAKKEIRVRWQLQRIEKRYVLAPPKSRRALRDLPLLPVLASALKEHKRAQAAERLALGDEWKTQLDLPHDWPAGTSADLVFTTETGAPLEGGVVTKAFQKALAKAGLPHKRLHDARHGAGDNLLEMGVDLKVISEWLGHSGIGLTANTYLRVRKPQLGAAAEKLGKLFDV